MISTARHKFETVPLFMLTCLVYILPYTIPDPLRRYLTFNLGNGLFAFYHRIYTFLEEIILHFS